MMSKVMGVRRETGSLLDMKDIFRKRGLTVK